MNVSPTTGLESSGTDDGTDDDHTDARPDECDCISALGDHGLPCWPCYAAGFRDPNPEYPGDDVDDAAE